MTGTVLSLIRKTLRERALHMTLLDPASLPAEEAEEVAAKAAAMGTDAIMVGGSTGVTGENLDELVKRVKRRTALPVIHFPSSAGALSQHVDAVYFLSTLNSRSPRVLVREQAHAAPLLRTLGIEAIGLGYIIVEPGMKVGLVSEADAIPRTREGADLAAGYALAAEMFGMPLVYLEAGSGAGEPVPAEMVARVRAATTVPLIVGGGIRERKQAEAILAAGADVLVTGTVAERGQFDGLREIVSAVKTVQRPVRNG